MKKIFDEIRARGRAGISRLSPSPPANRKLAQKRVLIGAVRLVVDDHARPGYTRSVRRRLNNRYFLLFFFDRLTAFIRPSTQFLLDSASRKRGSH